MLGAHVSISDGFTNACDDLSKHHGKIIQIFTTSPRGRRRGNKHDMVKMAKYLKKLNMKIVIHSSYILNFAKNWTIYSWWLKEIEIELDNSVKLGSIGVVLHMGKKLDLSIEEAMNNMYTAIIRVLNNTDDGIIILETPAGQGTEMCTTTEELARFYNKFKKSDKGKRVKICVDTCHIFAAGYDIRKKTVCDKYFDDLDKLIGIENVILIHLNDSATDCNSHVDRHANIGDGYIGKKPLMYIYKKLSHLPIILETPGKGYRKEIKLLKSG